MSMSRKDRKKRPGARGRQKSIREHARPYVALMLRHKEFNKLTSLRLKRESDEVLDAVIAHAKKSRAHILGNPQPKSVDGLGGDLPTDFSRETLTELHWCIATAIQYREEVASFLSAKEDVEQLLIRG